MEEGIKPKLRTASTTVEVGIVLKTIEEILHKRIV